MWNDFWEDRLLLSMAVGGIKQYGIQFLSSPIESHGIPKIIREIQQNTERYSPAMRWVA